MGELDDDLDLKDLETRARDVANRLEAAMSKVLGSTSKEYAAKSRSLLFNLQDKNNASDYAEKQTMALLETSALDSSNVNAAFECIIKGKSSPYNCLEIYK